MESASEAASYEGGINRYYFYGTEVDPIEQTVLRKFIERRDVVIFENESRKISKNNKTIARGNKIE